MNATKTHDPSKSAPAYEYEPEYADVHDEQGRLIRCLQQQIEDCFTTISRIEAQGTARSRNWRTIREGLRCWRAAIRTLDSVRETTPRV